MKKVHLFFSLALLSLVLLSQSVSAAGPNLIQNPSFETATAGMPNQWSKISWGSVIATFAYPVTGQTGVGAAVTLSSNTSGDSRWAHTPVTVEPGAVYEYSNWYKSDITSHVNTKFISSNGTVSWGLVVTLPSSNNTWKLATASISIPSGVTSLVVFHLITQKGTLTVDDFTLAKRDGAPPPPPPSGNGFPEGMVTFSFDDAWVSQYTNALPILQDAGIKGTFYIPTGRVINGLSAYMTPTQINDVAGKEHEIGGHTITHPNLTTLSSKRIDTEIKDSKMYLENLTGKGVSSLAYPFGAYNTLVKSRTTAAGYTNARSAGTTIVFGFSKATRNVLEIGSFSPTSAVSLSAMKAAIDKAKTDKEWFVFSFHKVDNSGGEYNTSVSDFTALVDYVKSVGIKTVTMKEGAALLR